MGTLYLIDHNYRNVFIFSAEGASLWRFSRLSDLQRTKNQSNMCIVPTQTQEDDTSWVLEDRSAGTKSKTIGVPMMGGCSSADHPPYGLWLLWGQYNFTLTNIAPEYSPPARPFTLALPFADVTYYEEGNIARLEIVMNVEAITDEGLEKVLAKFEEVLHSLGMRSQMVLFIRSDARKSAVPAMRHVMRFLSFVRENGPEFVLVGRGHAVILKSHGFTGRALRHLLELVQYMLPAPYPETTVSTIEEADVFLEELASRVKQSSDGKPPSPVGADSVEFGGFSNEEASSPIVAVRGLSGSTKDGEAEFAEFNENDIGLADSSEQEDDYRGRGRHGELQIHNCADIAAVESVPLVDYVIEDNETVQASWSCSLNHLERCVPCVS